MIKKLFMLFKIGRKLSNSGAITSIYEIYKPPILVRIIFFIIGFNFKNIESNDEYRSMDIPVKNGDWKIEIVGTHVVPEFGTIAMIVLAVAIVSIIAVSAKSRLSIMPRI